LLQLLIGRHDGEVKQKIKIKIAKEKTKRHLCSGVVVVVCLSE
jgi:hypothetical protein